jgi:hypothetical protein
MMPNLDRDGAYRKAAYALAMAYDSVVITKLRVVKESQSIQPLCYRFEFVDDRDRYEADVTLTEYGIAVTRVA